VEKCLYAEKYTGWPLCRKENFSQSIHLLLKNNPGGCGKRRNFLTWYGRGGTFPTSPAKMWFTPTQIWFSLFWSSFPLPSCVFHNFAHLQLPLTLGTVAVVQTARTMVCVVQTMRTTVLVAKPWLTTAKKEFTNITKENHL
jgi:hypothetical protein